MILHLGLARIRQDTAIAERTRSEFRAALKPADHSTFGEYFGGFRADVSASSADCRKTDEPLVHRLLPIPVFLFPTPITKFYYKRTPSPSGGPMVLKTAAPCYFVARCRPP